jgi:hypothetical protein
MPQASVAFMGPKLCHAGCTMLCHAVPCCVAPHCRAVVVVLSFEAHVERLFLLLLLVELPQHPASSQGMAFIAMLLSLASITRILLLALTRTFFGVGSEASQEVERGLGGAADWSSDEMLKAAAAGVLGLALEPQGSPGVEEGGGEEVP